MRIPGNTRTFVICRVQFFNIVGVYSNNYNITIRRVWHEQVELNQHSTHWKPTTRKQSTWFDLWRRLFPQWHTIEEGHYSKSARKGLISDNKAFHIVREAGFNKLRDYWEEFIFKTPELNPPNRVNTLKSMKIYSSWKNGKRNTPEPCKPSMLKINQPFPTLNTFTCELSRKLDMKRKAPISEQCALCTSFNSWIHQAKIAKDGRNVLLLEAEYKKHKDTYDWSRSKIAQLKETAVTSYKGMH